MSIGVFFKRTVLLSGFLLMAHHLLALEPFGTWADKRLLKRIARLHQPKEMERSFMRHKKKYDIAREDLGFGWQTKKIGVAGWDVTVTAQFYYYEDSVISYCIEIHLPNKPVKQRRYLQRCMQRGDSLFKRSRDGVWSRVSNVEALSRPLEEYNGTPPTLAPSTWPILAQCMSPMAGTHYMYHVYSSPKMEMPANRALFDQLGDSLSTGLVEYLLHAINPATRFLAIEYYWTHPQQFGHRPDIDCWAEQNFSAVPTMRMKWGCDRYDESTRELVMVGSLLPRKTAAADSLYR
jgi:hypothetical protein